jgi:hypothetical protein
MPIRTTMEPPVGQFEIAFTIREGETTVVALDEAQMLPYDEATAWPKKRP